MKHSPKVVPINKLMECQCVTNRNKSSKRNGMFKVYELGYFDDKKNINRLKLKCANCGREREVTIQEYSETKDNILIDF